MKWFAETTKFSGITAPNHVYLMDDAKNKMYAYSPFGSGKIQVFKNPIRIDLRGRKFVINDEQYRTDIKEAVPEGRSWKVAGSKGNEYTVTENRNKWSCTCSGFKFRSQCRHITDLQ